MRRLGALTLLLAVLLTGCAKDPPKPAVRLDGTARFPDDEGVATALDRDHITLDGKRTYKISDDLRSFSTYTRKIEPMLGRKGQYVQIGVDHGEMVWMGGVARIVQLEGEADVLYVGRFRQRARGRFVFTDGTTFAPGKGITAPGTKNPVTVRVDTTTHQIVEIS